MRKCDFNKAAIEITIRHGCFPVNLLHIFRTPFLKNTSGWLLLMFALEYIKNKLSITLSCLFINKSYNNNMVELLELR